MENTDAKQELEKILQQDEYQAYQEESKNFLQVWWEKVKDWVAGHLSDWFNSLTPSSGAADAILLLIIVLVVVGLVIGIVLWSGRVKRSQRFRDIAPLQGIHERQWSYRRHLSEVRKQEGEAAYPEAARHLFLAVLLYFHEREWLETRIWKTNWDYYEELRKGDQQKAEQFYQLALLFEEVTYGNRRLEQDEYDAYRSQAINWLESTEYPASKNG
ncbi:DUF4129 domain-containing protein [Sediminibacillus halophilus]|uniref:Protein-glutamine gamma-glutamyltransferase-like C-terminal domain-containing protein n=1 Tax=Sediminibacillus halophilus TaxID=482461 RepID=A0A1G9UEP6_9BACI|nr:DUF4129 domain-containing protein [Sediminibacillus halophilus]SDM58427.1 protein of unknown function [Sediminibacillus halophilus]